MSEETDGTGRFARLARRTKEGSRRLREALAANLREALTASAARSFHTEAVVYVYLFNVLFMTLLARSYLSYVDEGTSFSGWLVTLVAFISNFALVCLVLMVVLAPVAVLARRWWITLIIIPCVFTVMNFFLCADMVVYGLFRRHLNDGMVLNVLTTPGAGDSVVAGLSTTLSGVRIVLSVLVMQLAFSLCAYPYLRRRAFASRIRSGKMLAMGGALLFVFVLTDKLLYATADLRDNTQSMQSSRLFPLYVPLTVKYFARGVLGMDISTDRRVKLGAIAGSMSYPKAPIEFDPGAPRSNVLIIAVEGGRFDVLDPKVMPFLCRWAEKNVVFKEHYSAGNGSRFGLFGLLYGIHATYWHRVLAERRGSVLVEALENLGYEFSILSCTNLDFPEFRKTAFVDILEAITDTWDCERVERDRLMSDAFLDFLKEREPTRPFFAFMFYDASHQAYSYPPEHAVFETDAEPGGLNYVKVARDLSLAMPFRERFKNSLHYIDSQVERVIGALEELGSLDDTLVFITGDHGEEFCELGLFGHNTAFHRYQAKTFMVAHVPGQAPRRVIRLTNHVDIVPTIFTYMGVKNPLSDYTHGVPLTSPEGPEYVIVAGWGDAGLVDKDAITHFGLRTVVMDHDYNELPDQSAEKARRAKWYAEALEAQQQFVK